MRVGKKITVNATRYDGELYRWWEAIIEDISEDYIITVQELGQKVNDQGEVWETKVNTRSFYWTSKHYNLTESYSKDGQPLAIYVNIASPMKIIDSKLVYKDYELDILRKFGDETVHILDEEEFYLASRRYNYSDSFIENCRNNLLVAIESVNNWTWTGFRKL